MQLVRLPAAGNQTIGSRFRKEQKMRIGVDVAVMFSFEWAVETFPLLGKKRPTFYPTGRIVGR